MSVVSPAARDVFYRVSVLTDETYYIDTFGSDFDTSIRVFHNISCRERDRRDQRRGLSQRHVRATLAVTIRGDDERPRTASSSRSTAPTRRRGTSCFTSSAANRKGLLRDLDGYGHADRQVRATGINDSMGNCGGGRSKYRLLRDRLPRADPDPDGDDLQRRQPDRQLDLRARARHDAARVQ